MKEKSVLLFILLCALHGMPAQAQAPVPAQVIPEFQFFKLDNTPFVNKDLPAGKLLFILFFDPECDHCRRAVKSINDQCAAFKKTSVFLISIDGKNKITRFLDACGSTLKQQKNVTILQDKLQQFFAKFNPVKYPSMFLYSADKKLIDYEDDPEAVFRIVNAIRRNTN